MSDFLSDVKFFSCQICDPLTELPSLQMALNGTASLEVLVIQNGCDRFTWPSVPLDGLFTHIINQPLLFSLSILAVGAGYDSYFKFSEEVFDHLQQTFQSMNCNHHRCIQVAGGTIIHKSSRNPKHLTYTTTYTFCDKCPSGPAFT